MSEAIDNELTEWVSQFIGQETRYTVVPPAYDNDYIRWFSQETIRSEFNGNLIEACKSHPVFHAFYLCGYRLRPYQAYMMDQLFQKKYVLSIWGRRLGKSLIYKLFTHWAMHWNKYPQGGDKSTKIMVLAHTQDSAESYISELNEYIQTGDQQIEKLFRGKLGDKYFSSRLPTKGVRGKKVNQTVMQYLNCDNTWSSIEVYPPTTRPRGRPASIIIMDELAFWGDYATDEYKIYREVVRPIVTDQPNVKIFGASTPNGPSGLCYDLMDIDGHKTIFELVWMPFYYREEQSYYSIMKEIYDEYKASNSLDAFRQEYLSELVSARGAYFEQVEIDQTFDPTLRMLVRYSGECDASIDFGGSTTSRTVITIAVKELGKDKFGKDTVIARRIYHKRYALQQDSTLREDIMYLTKLFPAIRKWHIDSQGGGSSFYSWFRTNIGIHKLDEVNFRAEKVDMYRLFKIGCFQGRVKTYFDTEMMSEFNSFTANLKPTKGHTDDLLDSFVMCVKEWLIVPDYNQYASYLMPGRSRPKGNEIKGRYLTRGK